jgi:hypothetical protein
MCYMGNTYPKTHRYRRTAQQIIPGCGRINRCMGKYTERKNTNTRKKLLLIGKTRPKCFWMLYVVLSWPRACCAKLVSAPPERKVSVLYIAMYIQQSPASVKQCVDAFGKYKLTGDAAQQNVDESPDEVVPEIVTEKCQCCISRCMDNSHQLRDKTVCGGFGKAPRPYLRNRRSVLEQLACTFCACTQYIRKNETTKTSHSVSNTGGSKPEIKILNHAASVLRL